MKTCEGKRREETILLYLFAEITLISSLKVYYMKDFRNDEELFSIIHIDRFMLLRPAVPATGGRICFTPKKSCV